MIKITMPNSQIVKWHKNEYTDYRYDGKFFIIICADKWVGFYNLDHVISVVVTEELDRVRTA